MKGLKFLLNVTVVINLVAIITSSIVLDRISNKFFQENTWKTCESYHAYDGSISDMLLDLFPDRLPEHLVVYDLICPCLDLSNQDCSDIFSYKSLKISDQYHRQNNISMQYG